MALIWTDELRNRLAELIAQGHTIPGAAQLLGVTERAAEHAISRYQLRPPRPPCSVAPPQQPIDPVVQHAQRARAGVERVSTRELLDRIVEAEKRARFVADLRAGVPPPEIARREFGGDGAREATAIALLSDAHIEEVVRSEAVAGRNVYNLEISETRMSRFFAGLKWMIEFHRERFRIRDVILWLGGDLMTGHIHDELIETNDAHPLEATLTLRGRLRSGIEQLLGLADLERLIIPCNVGNHGRTTARRRLKTLTENSYEWLLYNVLAGDFAHEKRVTFEVPRSAHTYLTAYGFRLHFHHGDELTYAGGIGGLAIPLGRRAPRWESVRESDYHFLGHWHQFRDFGRTIVNGSMIGYSEYAMAIGAEFEPPQQAFLLLDSKRGKTCVSPIWVGEESTNG